MRAEIIFDQQNPTNIILFAYCKNSWSVEKKSAIIKETIKQLRRKGWEALKDIIENTQVTGGIVSV